jgi:hypothetical protein
MGSVSRVHNLNQRLAGLASRLAGRPTAGLQGCAHLLYKVLAAPRRIFARLCPELCPSCEEACCQRVSHRGVMDTADLVFFALQGITALPAAARQDGLCPWLTRQGCALSWNARPFACLHYLCKPLQNAMSPSELAEVRTLLTQAGGLRSRLLKLFLDS